MSSREDWLSSRSIGLPILQADKFLSGVKIRPTIVFFINEGSGQDFFSHLSEINLAHDLKRYVDFIIHEFKSENHFARLLVQLPLPENSWICILRPGDKVNPSGLLMSLLSLPAKNNHSAIFFDEIYQKNNDQLAHLIFRPGLGLDYLISLPAFMSRHWLFNYKAVARCGGFNLEMGAAIDLDMIFRLIEDRGMDCISHICEPLVITSWANSIDIECEQKAIQSHLFRAGYLNARVYSDPPGQNRVRYNHGASPLASIIIAAGASLSKLIQCTERLLTNKEHPNYEIILFPTASSSPDVIDWLLSPACREENRISVVGFEDGELSSGYNDASAYASGDYLLFLSEDIIKFSPQWLDELFNHSLRKEVGIVGAKLLNPSGEIAHAGYILGLGGPIGSPFVGENFNSPGYMRRLQVDQNMSAVSLDCLMISKSLFDKLDGFSSGIATNYISTDLCLRAKKEGFSTVWTPHARLVIDAQSSPEPSMQEQDAMYEKWLASLARDPAYSPNLSLADPSGFVLADSRLSWRPLDELRPAPVVLVHPSDGYGSGHYRTIQPFLSMMAAGLLDGSVSQGLMHVVDLERYNPDTIILQKQLSDERLEAMRRMHRFSSSFKVYEIDDYLPMLPGKSTHKDQIPSDIVGRMKKGMGFADRLVVSTCALANELSIFHSDIIVVENRLPVGWWGSLESSRGQSPKPRVGWAGGIGHSGDLELIADVVRDLAKEVDWVFLGMCPDALRPYVHEFHSAVAIEQYPEKLASLNLDLAIAPLEINIFNQCKSNLRLLEYGACGIPVVCTDILPYQNQLPVTRVKNNRKDWVRAIREHISDLDGSERTGEALRHKINQEWMLDGESLIRWRNCWLSN